MDLSVYINLNLPGIHILSRRSQLIRSGDKRAYNIYVKRLNYHCKRRLRRLPLDSLTAAAVFARKKKQFI